MNIDKLQSVYFIGVGGIGMSALARCFIAMGIRVGGYDRVRTQLTDKLTEEGVEIEYREDPFRLPEWFLDTSSERALVVYTPAVPKTNAIFGFLAARGFEVAKRAEVLAAIIAKQDTIAIAGTHGKTTTTAMVAHIFQSAGLGCNAFLGGVASNFDSNLLYARGNKYAVVEADEYDRSLLKLNPQAAVITSVEADHLDVYGNEDNLKEGFQVFANLLPHNGALFLRYGLNINAGCLITTYAVEQPEADLTATGLGTDNGRVVFDVWLKGNRLGRIATTYPGRHNVENALAAIGVALHYGVQWEEISNAMATFSGVRRRFDYRINRPDRVFIDDYAHHPTELDACITSVRELFPTKRITGVFQPHLYSRTRDFADGFANSLSQLNELILMEIYPAREAPIEGVDAAWLLNKVRMVNKKLCAREELVDEVLNLDPEVLLTMGAGDIDKMIAPLKNALDEKDEEST